MTSSKNVNANGTVHKITLYTNHGCPFAHRAHIALHELGLSFEEVLIDLDTPRPQWYLDINPRGHVPSMKFSNSAVNEEIIIESAIVTQFLCDAFPSHLMPASSASPTAPLERARIAFFVDTWSTKCSSYLMQLIKAGPGEEGEKIAADFLHAVEKEIEPQLKNAVPFFNGSKAPTFAEVQVAPFLLRIYSLSRDGRYIPSSVQQGFDKLPNFSKWAKATMERPSVLGIWDEQKVLERTGERIKKMTAATK